MVMVPYRLQLIQKEVGMLLNLIYPLLADRLDAGEGEDRQGLAAFHYAVAKLHRPLLVEQKIFVDDQKNQVRIQVQVTLHDVVDVFAIGQQLDVFTLEEVRRATEVTAVGAA